MDEEPKTIEIQCTRRITHKGIGQWKFWATSDNVGASKKGGLLNITKKSLKGLGKAVAEENCSQGWISGLEFKFETEEYTMSPNGLDSYQYKRLTSEEAAKFLHYYMKKVDKLDSR